MIALIDITERKEIEQLRENYQQDLEQQVIERTKALQESEERFRRAFEDAPIGMALLDLTGKWLQVNQTVLDITGYSESELLSLSFQDITHPDDLELDLSYARRLLTGEI